MRVIEQQMLAAIKGNRNWSKDNTAISHFDNVAMGFVNIKLHDNLIAVYDKINNECHVNVDVLRRYPTNTTKSRLRALGVNVKTVKGIIYLNGEVL